MTRPAVQPYVLLALIPFATGYFFSYLLRNANGQISGRLMETFHLGPQELGLLTSLYFLGFALFQLPAGLLIDHYGPRKVQAGMLGLAAAGAAAFGLAENLGTLMVGRALIGLGTSTALVTGLKAITLLVPAGRRVAARSCLVTFGAFGAIMATLPMEWVAETVGWRAMFLAAAGMQLGLAAILARDPHGVAPGFLRRAEMFQGMGLVLRSKPFWRIVPVSSTTVGGVFAIHGLWAARWLADVHGLSAHQAAGVLLCMGIGLAAGGPVLGVLAHAAQRSGMGLGRVYGGCVLALVCAEAAMLLDVAVPPALLLGVLAAFGAMTVLGFSMIDDLFPPELSGRVNAVYNVIQMGTTFGLQAGFGMVVAFWRPGAEGGAPAAGYMVAIGCVIAVQLVGLLIFAGPAMVRRSGRGVVA